jgi:hypothetical protein
MVEPPSSEPCADRDGQAAKFKYRYGKCDHSMFWDRDQTRRSPLSLSKPAAVRSIATECLTNDGGKWRLEYEYVTSAPAKEGCWKFKDCLKDKDIQASSEDSKTADDWLRRDLGRNGRTLEYFATHGAAIHAKLSLAEVTMLRLYTGPMFKPLNDALRYCVSTDGKAVTADTLAAQQTLEDWWTCISVLICACFKLSFVPSSLTADYSLVSVTGTSVAPTPENGPREVIRGVDMRKAKSLTDCEEGAWILHPH